MTATDDVVARLCERARPAVYRYLSRRCGDCALAEDLTQESLMVALQAARRGMPVDVAWVVGVARNKLREEARRRRRENERHAAFAAPPYCEDPDCDALDGASALLAELPPRQRTAVVLRHITDLPVPRVAALMATSVSATESLLARARRDLRLRAGPLVSPTYRD